MVRALEALVDLRLIVTTAPGVPLSFAVESPVRAVRSPVMLMTSALTAVMNVPLFAASAAPVIVSDSPTEKPTLTQLPVERVIAPRAEKLIVLVAAALKPVGY